MASPLCISIPMPREVVFQAAAPRTTNIYILSAATAAYILYIICNSIGAVRLALALVYIVPCESIYRLWLKKIYKNMKLFSANRQSFGFHPGMRELTHFV